METVKMLYSQFINHLNGKSNQVEDDAVKFIIQKNKDQFY